MRLDIVRQRFKELRAPLIFTLVLLLAGFVGFGYGKVVKNRDAITPSLCNQCHQMEQKVAGWKSSGHNTVSCLSCHGAVPFTAIIYKPVPLKEGDKTYLTRPVSNQVCENCHKPQVEARMPGDLINAHQAHLDKGLDCVDCHRWTGHSPPGTSMPGPFKGEGGPSMNKCLICHNGVKAPSSCESCHRDKKAPDSHKQKAWNFLHGGNMTAQADSCNKCHGYDTQKENKGNFKSFDLTKSVQGKIEFKGKVNCGQCHSPGHESNWIEAHIPTVNAQGPAKCQTCHSLEGCASCHRLKAKK